MGLINTEYSQSGDDIVETLVRNAAIEMIPLNSAVDKLMLVPAGRTITVTCSSRLGLDRTLDFTIAAAKAGYQVVPHLAARQVTDAATLRNFVGRLEEVGVRDLYVIGGDAADAAGPYHCSAELLEALRGFDHGITRIGVACYPEGHPAIPEAKLLEALRRVQPHVDYMVSQLCFESSAITGWLHKIRQDGVTLPLHLGLASPLQVRKLVELSLKIGVGSSVRYLTKQHGFVGKVLRGSSYRPEELLERLSDALSDADYAIEGLHLFTFNQMAETIAWQASIGA